MANTDDSSFQERSDNLEIARFENLEVSQIQRRSLNDLPVSKYSHLALKKSKSWSCSPRNCSGIPLGSLTAQAAAKPFWGKDMLQERIQEIAEYAALETSSLGSSIDDSLSITELEELEEECDDIPTFNISNEDEPLASSRSAPAVPRHDPNSPDVLRSQSAQLIRSDIGTKQLSKSQPSSRMGARTLSATPRLTNSTSNLSIQGEKMQLKFRRKSTPNRDDGFHEK